MKKWLFLVVLASYGCGGVADVSGKVTLSGKPLPLGLVTMFPQTGGPLSGIIQPDGQYLVKEVPVGDVRVSVHCRDPRPKPGRRQLQGPHPAYTQAQMEAWFPIPDVYGDPLRSGLSFTATKGENRYDIDLTEQAK